MAMNHGLKFFGDITRSVTNEDHHCAASIWREVALGKTLPYVHESQLVWSQTVNIHPSNTNASSPEYQHSLEKSTTWRESWLTEFRFYVTLDTKYVISETFPKPGLVTFYNIWPGNAEGLVWFRRFINLSLTSLLRHLPTYLQPQDTHRAYEQREIFHQYSIKWLFNGFAHVPYNRQYE